MVDATADGVTVEQLKATDFSRPTRPRRAPTRRQAELLSVSAQRVEDLTVTLLCRRGRGPGALDA